MPRRADSSPSKELLVRDRAGPLVLERTLIVGEEAVRVFVDITEHDRHDAKLHLRVFVNGQKRHHTFRHNGPRLTGRYTRDKDGNLVKQGDVVLDYWNSGIIACPPLALVRAELWQDNQTTRCSTKMIIETYTSADRVSEHDLEPLS